MLWYFTKKNTRRYIDILQATASKCNASHHRGIKMAPKYVNKDKEIQVWINRYGKRISHNRRKRSNFSVGDLVRLSIEKAPFVMRCQEIWTAEVFIIHTIVYGNPTACKIKDQDNKPVKGIFYIQRYTAFYVYTGIIQNQLVGDVRASLLRVVPVKLRHGETTCVIYKQLRFPPLSTSNIQTT